MRSAWNQHCTMRINKAAALDLQHLTNLLQPSNSAAWSRPLGLLIPREPHFHAQSDACNTAMGGLCQSLKFQWRLSNCAFANLPPWVQNSPSPHLWHINIHKFIALIINTFFAMMSFLYTHSTSPSSLPTSDGWIFLLQADNTTALSWIRRLSRNQDKHITQLCQLFSHLVFSFNTLHPANFDGQHLAGVLNIKADALSCPQLYPTYQDLFDSFPEMASLPAY